MILAEAILIAVLISLATGGSLKRLAQEPLKGEVALLVLLSVQLLWPTVSQRLSVACPLGIIVWLLMMAGLATVLMVNAPRRWQLAVAALGISANILVIGLNQAMPVSIKAASEIGASRQQARAALKADCLHEEMDESTLIPLLADIVAVPGPPWQRGVISLGDVLLAFGLGAWVFAAARGNANPA